MAGWGLARSVGHTRFEKGSWGTPWFDGGLLGEAQHVSPSPKERLWRGQRCGDLGRVPYLIGDGEGMGGGGAFGDDFGGRGLPADGARDRLLDRAIVEVLDLLVVAGFPMDEHADANEEIVGLVGGNHALGDSSGR